ncbi:MAG: H/ACA ribonucleoprotein complex subunit GAR1 [Halodesulfurarchaeum sp.]
MKRLGTVRRIAGNLLVLTAADPDHPPIGTTAIDESLATVGRVVDVFGPVEEPYLAVSPDADTADPALVGATLYWRAE